MTEYHWIMTVLFEERGQARYRCRSGVISVHTGATREATSNVIFGELTADIPGDSVVTYFSLEPNRLGAA